MKDVPIHAMVSSEHAQSICKSLMGWTLTSFICQLDLFIFSVSVTTQLNAFAEISYT